MVKTTHAELWRAAFRGLVRGLALTLVISSALNLLMFAVPLYSMQMYTRVLGSGRVETLLLLSLITGLALVALGLFEIVRTSLLARIASRLEQTLARPLIEAAARSGGAGVGGLRDLAQLRAALTGPAMSALLDAPWLPAALVVVWLVHPLLGAFTVASALALGVCAVLNDLLTRRPQRRAGQTQLEAQTLTEALARKAEAVRALGMVDALAFRIRRLHDASLAGQQQAGERGGVVLGMTRALRLGVQAGVLGLSAWLVLQNELTPGAMLAAAILVSKALAPVEQMVGTWKTMVVARDSWSRLRALLATAPAPRTIGLPRPRGELSVEGASVCTADGRSLLRNLSFRLEPGQTLVVVGPSGAGKSTLCRLLTGVLPADLGAVRLDGAELGHYAQAELGGHLGYLPQEPMLFAGSVAENIARMAPEPAAAAVIEASRRADAHELILHLPAGYETQLLDGGAPLSGGQRQRIGLARALYGDPRLVVLDEPNANLDAQGLAALMATLARLKQAGITTVIVTHWPQLLQRADRVLVLEDGQVSHFGEPETVLAHLVRPARAA